MPTDYVYPNGNEQQFILMAERLGYDTLVLCYAKQPPKSLPKTDITLKIASEDVRAKADIFLSRDAKKTRELIERSKVDIFFELESQQRKDFMHQRASGLNHVLCKLMVKKEKQYALSITQLLGKPRREQARILGRMRQNAMLCKKFGVPLEIASFARAPNQMCSPHDIKVII